MLVDWKIIEKEYEKDSVKEFFTHILYNLEKELVIAFINDFLSSIIEQQTTLTFGTKLIILKNLFTLIPKEIYSTISLSDVFQNWLFSSLMETSTGVSSSIRSVGLQILSLFLKNFRKETLKLERMSQIISNNILNACSLILHSQPTEENFQLGQILLHSCVDVTSFTFELETNVTWMKSIGYCLHSTLQTLQYLSSLSVLSFQGNSQIFVDISKLFSRVVEISLLRFQSTTERSFQIFSNEYFEQVSETELTSMISQLPESVFRIICCKEVVVHDSFQAAFQSSLDLISFSKSCLIDGSFVNNWMTKVTTQIESCLLLQLPPVVSSEVDPVPAVSVSPAPSTPSIMDIARVESLFGVLSILFDMRGTSTKDQKKESGSGEGQSTQTISMETERDWLIAAERAFNLIILTITQLKTLLPQFPTNQQKSLRTLASNVRKGSIALSESILTTCPLILRCPELFSLNIRPNEFVRLFCLKTLSTPVLFSQIYRAITQPEVISFTDSNISLSNNNTDRNEMVQLMIQQLDSGLKQITQYSSSSATDLITTVEDLIQANCVEILSPLQSSSTSTTTSTTINIPLSVMKAYLSHPKSSPASATNSNDMIEWKLHCMTCLQSILSLSTSLSKSNSVQSTVDQSSTLPFLELFVNHVCSDILSLHQCFGNISTRKLTVNTPSARDKLRKEATKYLEKNVGTSDSEELFPLLQNLIELLNQFVIKLIHCQERDTSIPVTVFTSLIDLFHFLLDICQRSLLFEDDCTLLCSEIDLMGNIVSLLSNKEEEEMKTTETTTTTTATTTNVSAEQNSENNPSNLRQTFIETLKLLKLKVSNGNTNQIGEIEIKIITENCVSQISRFESSPSSSSSSQSNQKKK